MSERNHEITQKQFLLNEHGSIAEPGWAKSQLQQYRRKDIKASASRIKEWDYYLVLNKDFAVALTVNDMSYLGMVSVSFIDFVNATEHTETILTPMPMGKFNMPENTLDGDVLFENERIFIRFGVEEGYRHITCKFENFDGEKNFRCDITMEQPKMDSMVIATPWMEDPEAFYYNQKINCMPAKGWVTYGSKVYKFDKSTDFGTLDWGRGVWTRDNTWYWGSGNGYINDKPFGFNIGYGFGDTSAASENILFYDGVAHKLDDIVFHIPQEDFLLPWKFTSSDGRFEMNFEPIIDRNSYTDMKMIISDQHQVFGKMNGTAILDDGTQLEIKDFLCFAEKVRNKY